MRAIFLDLETADAEQLHTYGPGFVRLAGYAVNDGPVVLTTDIGALCGLLRDADLIYGHNVLAFDLAALERWHGLDLEALIEADKVRDTLLIARQVWPPLSGAKKPQAADGRGYSLDDCAARLGLDSKLRGADGGSALKGLAKTHGGYDRIPVDDPLYREYLQRDVELTRAVAVAPCMRMSDYLRREHRVMWRLSQISRYGFRVDVPELERLLAVELARVEEYKRDLHERVGLPLTGKMPHRSKVGIAALEAEFERLGVEVPRTEKGFLATNRETLEGLLEAHPDNDELDALCTVLMALNGQTALQLIADHVAADGRVHPKVDASQASGRISVTKPALTTLGKRKRAKILDRSVLLADEGDVLLCVDLSQIDARGMGALSQDPTYLAALAPGQDMHSAVAAQMFGDRARRSDAKAITHATSYGMGAARLAESLGCDVFVAQGHLNRLDATYPLLRLLKERSRAVGETVGVLSTAYGRRIAVARDRSYTQSPAALGQGTARDLMMEGVLRLPPEAVPRLRAIVHDEIVLSVPAANYEECRAQVLAALTFAFTMPADYSLLPHGVEVQPVPILAETGEPGADWADCYREELAKWPEVAAEHRQLASAACSDAECVWHCPGGLGPEDTPSAACGADPRPDDSEEMAV